MPSHLRSKGLLGLAGAVAVLAVGAWACSDLRSELAAARQRVATGSESIETRFGRLEYAVAGSGPALLMIHGTGGGFDQGLHLPQALAARPIRRIAPSRFGYLRSDFPPDPSPQHQADALVELLDHLGLQRVVVAGGSAGALSAVQLALRHPRRCAGLVLLVPAANVRGRDPVEMGPATRWLVERVLASDAAFWLAKTLSPGRLLGTLLATDPALLERVSPAERQRAWRTLDELMPVGARVRGMLADARFASRPAEVDFTRIGVPTLILSAEDDRFGTAATAREIAARMPQARLVVFPSGGHLWLGHDEAVADEVMRFVAGLGTGRGGGN